MHPMQADVDRSLLAQAAEPDFGFGQEPYREFSGSDVLHPASIPFSRRRQPSAALGPVLTPTYTYTPAAPAVTESLCSTPTNVSPALTRYSGEIMEDDNLLETTSINVQDTEDHQEWSTSARTHADSHLAKCLDFPPAVGVRETGPATRVYLEDNEGMIDSNPSTPELVHMPSPLLSSPSPKTPITRVFTPSGSRFYDPTATKRDEVEAWRHDVPQLDELETQRRPDSRIHQRPCLHRHCSLQERAARGFSQEFAGSTEEEERDDDMPAVPEPIQIDSNHHTTD